MKKLLVTLLTVCSLVFLPACVDSNEEDTELLLLLLLVSQSD